MIYADVQCTVFDPKTGAIVREYPAKPANSLVKQFAQVLAVQMGSASLAIKREQDGVEVTTGARAAAFRFTQSGKAGIYPGTGATAVTIDDYALVAPINAGITLGTQNFTVDLPDANTARLKVTRVITNTTGSPIAVEEVAWFYNIDFSPYGSFLMDRTLYSVSIPAGLAVTIAYRLWITLGG